MQYKGSFIQAKKECAGKTSCRIVPTSTMFNVHCEGWRRMWITWSCDGGTDKTTAVIPRQKEKPKPKINPRPKINLGGLGGLLKNLFGRK